MAGRSKDILLKFLVDDKQKSKLAGIGQEAGKVQGKFSQLSGGAKALVGGLVALGATKIVGFLKDASDAALADEQAQRQLALALENTTGASQSTIDKTEEWIDSMQRTKGVADDELRPALATLLRATGDVDTAQRNLNIALDIAAATGRDVETVSLAMAKASNGNVGALGRLGLKVKDADGKLLSYEEVLQSATDLMGGAAMENASSLEGQMARQAIAWDEAKEAIGARFLPVLTTATTTMGYFLALLDGNTDVERMESAFNGLVNAGIDPFADRLRSATTVLLEANRQSEITAGSISTLKDMFELTGPEIGQIEQYLIDNAAQLGLTGDEYKEVVLSLQAAKENWRDARESGVEPHTEALEKDEAQVAKEEAALKKLHDQVKIGTDRFKAEHDAIRSASDSMFNLTDKTKAQAAAQKNVNDAANTYGTDSPEYLQAVQDAAEANQDVDDALRAIVASGGMTRAEFVNQQTALGLTKDQANLLADQLDRIGAFHPNPINFEVTVNGKKFAVGPTGNIGMGSGGLGFNVPIPGMASGGIVPGPLGSPQLTVVHGGETVIPANGGAAAGVTLVNQGVIGSSRELENWLVRAVDNAKRHGRL